jgi:hypothetical protein
VPKVCDFSDIRFEVLAVVSVNIAVFQNVTSCCLVVKYPRFERNELPPSLGPPFNLEKVDGKLHRNVVPFLSAILHATPHYINLYNFLS